MDASTSSQHHAPQSSKACLSGEPHRLNLPAAYRLVLVTILALAIGKTAPVIRMHVSAFEPMGAGSFVPGAAARNWESYVRNVTLPHDMPGRQKNLLAGPQTSGGLMLTCVPENTDKVLRKFHDHGHTDAAVIGSVTAGRPRVTIC